MNEEEKKGNNTYIHLVIGSVFGPVEQHIEAVPRESKANAGPEQVATAKMDRVEGEASDALPAAPARPQPDSPTTPKVFPVSIRRFTSSTACKKPFETLKYFLRCCVSSRILLMPFPSQTDGSEPDGFPS